MLRTDTRPRGLHAAEVEHAFQEPVEPVTVMQQGLVELLATAIVRDAPERQHLGQLTPSASYQRPIARRSADSIVEGESPDLAVAQALVLRQDDLDGVSANLQLAAEAEHDVPPGRRRARPARIPARP